jgi:predicted outer membrane repeat protein
LSTLASCCPVSPLARASIACVLLLLAPETALSATFLVDTALDSIDASPGDGRCADAGNSCSVRAAILEANASPGVDEIRIPAGRYPITLLGRDSEGLVGDFNVADDVRIVGGGADLTVLDGSSQSTILRVAGANVVIENIAFENAYSSNSFGAVLAVGGSLTIADCRFEDNVGFGGSALLLFAVSASVERCTFRRNTADEAAVEAVDATLTMIDVSFDANSARRAAAAALSGGSAVLRQVTFTGNSATEGGALTLGDAASVFVELSSFDSNVATRFGGAILLLGGGDDPDHLSLSRCTFRGNRASEGGALAARAGAGWLTAPIIQIDGCLFDANEATSSGGAIHLDSPFLGAAPSLDAVNCTFSGNSAPSGGAIHVTSGDGATVTVRLAACTVASNVATVRGGGIEAVGPTVIEAGHLVLGDNSAPESPDCFGPLTSMGYVLLEDGTGCVLAGDLTGTRVGVDPLLGPLQDNGGPTSTRGLLAGSAAIDGGAITCLGLDGAPLLEDQRGMPRPADGDAVPPARCDVGAYEECGPDTDGDLRGDACDCAPSDASAFAIPREPTLTVAKPRGTTDAVLSWDDGATSGGSGTRYEVAAATLTELRTRRVADAPCVQVGLTLPTWTDTVPPGPGEGFYYLVRGVNACGPAGPTGWGKDSLGVDRPACP